MTHPCLGELLIEVWGSRAWLAALEARYVQVNGLGDRNIVDVYRNDEGEEVVTFRSRSEVTELWHGMWVYLRPEEVAVTSSMPRSLKRTHSGSSLTRTAAGEVPGASPADLSSPTLYWTVNDNPFAIWYKSPSRRRYEGLAYEPGRLGHPMREFNMFRGFGVEPLASDNRAPFILEHLREVVCDGQSCLFDYLLNVLAFMVQHPDRKTEVVLAFLGEKGTGKNAVSTVMRMIFGSHALEIVDANHFTGRFNAHLAYINLPILNEAVWGGDKQAESILKAAVTDTYMMSEAKYGTPTLCENKWSFVVLTNSDFHVPITLDDRRFFVVRTTDGRRGDSAYFDRLYNSISDGIAVGEFFALLRQRQLPENWRPSHQIPRTAAWVDVMLRNPDEAALAWLVEKAREGRWAVPRPDWPQQQNELMAWDRVTTCPKQLALQAAQHELDRRRYTRYRPAFVGSVTAFTQALKRYLSPNLFKETFRHRPHDEVMYWFAPLRDIREHLARHVLLVPDYFGGAESHEDAMDVDS